ncbi:MAG TPA: glycosyltransferase [Nitrospirae bacterium]|nr:alpha-D-kanosaminyltransferase [bacterium BMS3Abin06]HDH13267.1 glycosyltransferase [Nitrospirota bacterium]HDZ01765.1 glycosyltransferase [Nitrospirota bacterium]
MRILLVNNFYYYRGGDCTYLFSLKKLLEEKGHEVSVFAMHHPQNLESEYSKYFVSYINYDEEVRNINIVSGFKVLNRTIYSREARIKVEKLIEIEKPDIAHIQNIHHHITPSIFYVLKKHNIPILWTLHDYTLICPNTSFLSHGRICEKCKNNKYFRPSIERCKKDSFGASTMAALETTMHRIMRLTDIVDIFIAPSEFSRRKFLEYGFPANKLVRLDLFTDIELPDKTKESDYYIYAGRMAPEKGIKTLIDAAVKIDSCKLKIVGSGPLLRDMKAYASSKDKNNVIEFLGHKDREELINLYKNCKFIVVPSEWYETSGLIIFEAFACGKPVVGSRIGGIPELVKDTERGLIFEPGDVEDLSAAIKYLLNNPDLVDEMGQNAKKFLEDEMGPEKHYEKLMEIYNQVLS